MSDKFQLIVPPHSVRWFPSGVHCYDPVQGDMILVKHKTVFADAICAGQEMMTLTEPELHGYTWCDHAAYLSTAGQDAIVDEMGPRGFESRKLYDYQARLYAVVHFEISDDQRATTVFFNQACSGVDYGWLEYIPLILDGLTDAKFAGSWGDAIICSTHLTMVMMGAGLFPDRPCNMVAPAHLALWVGAKKP